MIHHQIILPQQSIDVKISLQINGGSTIKAKPTVQDSVNDGTKCLIDICWAFTILIFYGHVTNYHNLVT